MDVRTFLLGTVCSCIGDFANAEIFVGIEFGFLIPVNLYSIKSGGIEKV